jgi:hypothetical protein
MNFFLQRPNRSPAFALPAPLIHPVVSGDLFDWTGSVLFGCE